MYIVYVFTVFTVKQPSARPHIDRPRGTAGMRKGGKLVINATPLGMHSMSIFTVLPPPPLPPFIARFAVSAFPHASDFSNFPLQFLYFSPACCVCFIYVNFCAAKAKAAVANETAMRNGAKNQKRLSLARGKTLWLIFPRGELYFLFFSLYPVTSGKRE